MPVKTKVTEMLGIEAPIIQGGMMHVGVAEMAAAVSNAGGLGVITALAFPDPEALRKEIHRCRTMTQKPFGVNLTILPALIPGDYDGYLRVICEERVALVEITGGSPRKYMKALKEAGVKVLHKSATLKHALKVQADGVDLIEIAGCEGAIAGRASDDDIGTWVLTAKAAQVLTTPFIVSGSSATGRQLAAAIAMGAQGITMGTRFVATEECPVARGVKDRLATPEADEASTCLVLSTLNNATRVAKNDVTREMLAIEKEGAKADGVDFSSLAPMASGLRTKKMWFETGDWKDSMWSCGQSAGLISDVPTCRVLIQRMVGEAESMLQHGASCCVKASGPASKL